MLGGDLLALMRKSGLPSTKPHGLVVCAREVRPSEVSHHELEVNRPSFNGGRLV